VRILYLLFSSLVSVSCAAISAYAQQPSPDPQAQTPQTATPSSGEQQGQASPATPATPQPLPNPTMTAPLQTAAPPHTFSAGPFGTVAVTGILSGMGLTQSNYVPASGNKPTDWDLSNGQIFLQKTTGWWQFYLQGGAYNLPDLGVPFIRTGDTLNQFYGPLPVGYFKLVKGNFNVEIGELPTLIGAEYTFSFENMNIERGLLWNQENAISRGVQVSDTFKKFSFTASWNDGFYSNRYNWITGTVAYAFNSANTLSFIGGGNVGQTPYGSVATPFLQNNGVIYEVIYTYSHEAWTITPYYQYTHVPANMKLGILESGSTSGGALLLNYNFKDGISLAIRSEYITSNGSAKDPNSLNLLGYGAGSNAFAFTATPTYQKGGFFLRGDLSVVDARSFTPGFVFGRLGLKGTQTRGVVEAGFMF
jgi:Putative beta-barrel porin-2, OmpL-like. bbp2